jgi:hypothetical protein
VTDVVVQQGSVQVRVGTANDTVVRATPAGTTVVQRDGSNNLGVVPVSPVAVRIEAGTGGPRVIELGTPGPAGAQGEPGPPGTAVLQRVAAQALGGHRLVRALADGSVDYVDSANPLHGDDTLGLTIGAVSAGALATVQTSGPIVEPSWAWTPGEPVFADVNGLLSQTPSGTAFTQVIGFAATATNLVIAIQPTIYN